MLKINFISEEKFSFLSFIKDENGAILLPFIVFLPVFIGLIFLSFEISHFLQKKARLSDAMEQATLTLTAINHSNNLTKYQEDKNSELVIAYADAYLPSEAFSVPVINIIPHPNYVEYHAVTSLSYVPKFLTKNFIAGIAKEIGTIENGVAIKNKFIAPTERIDVVFVTDYSSSMEDKFYRGSNGKSKIDSLRKIFERFNTTILKNSNINSIGFVPFSWGTKINVGEKQQVKKYCHFPFSFKDNNNVKQKIREHNAVRERASDSPSPIQKIIEDNVDYDETINLITERGKVINIDMSDIAYDDICLKGSDAYLLKEYGNSENIINDFIAMKPQGATLVSSGILAANNFFKESNRDNKKLMIILSDGEDTFSGINISKILVKKGMCERVKENDIRMVFIGIGYKSKSKSKSKSKYKSIDWEKCVGKNNYYQAQNAHELEADLWQALGSEETREIGRNTPKR
ncbi:MAG: TadE/TadG family protein [Yersinia sp. (in: enterobacteria)]